MDIATSIWFKELYEYKPSPSNRLDEVTRRNAQKTFEYMADHGLQIQEEFDYLFDGKMRIAVPLVETDTRNLIEIVEVLKAEGWRPPRANTMTNNVAFPTKLVKQKKRHLADEGGGEYEVELRVASLELVKEFDYTIPAGPREGETIKKINKTTMSRAITNAVKFKRLRPELLDWWRKKQTFYTKDEDGYNTIEGIFDGSYDDNIWSILISRHPVDVLRMSDIGEISSCHRAGGEYFQCAVEESMGNGLIAYLVKTEDLNGFLRDGEPHMVQANDLINRSLNRAATLEVAHKHLNSAQELATVLELLKGEWAQWALPSGGGSYNNRVSPEAIELVTVDMLRDAVRAKLDNKPWPDPADLPPPKPLGDFDQQEIFRDGDRDIPGIIAGSRLRLRKFFDSASGDWIAVPEDRVYGRGIDRFRTAVREWAWEQQSEMFKDDAAPDHLELPRERYLQRYGGSYEDTSDGYLLNEFFSMSGQEINQYRGNVEHVHGDEDDSTWERMEEELEEVLSSVHNRAEHVSFHAEVTGDEEPYVYGGADASFTFKIEWKGDMSTDGDGFYRWPDDERDQTLIPKSWGSEYQSRRAFEETLDDALKDTYSEETEWEVSSGYGSMEGETVLDVRMTFRFDEASPEEYDTWADYLLDDLDDNYDEIFERMRRALVVEGYLPPNDFDRLVDDIREQSEQLINWEALGVDEDSDYDGEIWFIFRPEEWAAGQTHSTPTPPLGVVFPKSIGNTPFALEKIFGSTASVENNGKVNPGLAFRTEMKAAFSALEEAANGYAAEQLEFDFGEKYNRPAFEGVDLSNSQLRFYLGRQNEVSFSLKVVIEATDSEEEIEGAFKFMRFLDQYPQQIIAITRDVYNKFLQHHLEKIAERDRVYLDGTKMQQLFAQVSSRYDAQANTGDVAAEQAIMVALFIRDNWEQFSKPEKHTAIDQYLRPLSSGSMPPYNSWDNDADTPRFWDNMVRELLISWKVANARDYKWGADWKPAPNQLAQLQNKMGMTPEQSVIAQTALRGLSDEDRSKAMDALVAGDREEFTRIVLQPRLRGTIGEPVPAGGPIVRNARGERIAESVEAQIDRVDKMLNEREPIDLRIYKVALGCVVDTSIAGLDNQIENQIRGIEEVTTVRNRTELERSVGAAAIYRVYEVKFELYGQEARDTYRDSVLVPAIEKEVTGVTVRDRGLPELSDSPLREWGGLGYAAPPYDHYLPTMPTPAVSLDSVLEDWAEGGVQIYDTPMNTNQMRYHVMMGVDELWKHCSRYYRGTKVSFDGGYKHFIKDGAQMPVYVALGQNGRVKITGNEDLIWFAKRSGLEELPVFFSYQRQV